MAVTTPTKYTAAETIVKFHSSSVSVLENDTLDSLFTSDDQIESLFKNVTVTPPEGSVEKVDLLGVDEDGFQNALLEAKPYGLATFTGTAVLSRKGFFEKFVDSASKQIETGGETYDRYQFGVMSATTQGRPKIAILVQDVYPYTGTTSDLANILLNEAYITKLGDYRISGPDSHWEIDVTAVCLPKDFYIEHKR